jgi:hypothetical protein
MKIKKYFLVLKKVRKWYMENKTDEVLLAALNDGTIPIRIIEKNVEQDVYLEIGPDGGPLREDEPITEIEVELLGDGKAKGMIQEYTDNGDRDGDPYERIFIMPDDESWIEVREIDDEKEEKK